jgi:hypothetical protein
MRDAIPSPTVSALVRHGEVVISEHGYDELANDHLSVKEIVEGVADASVVEDYPAYSKGPCVLTLQSDHEGRPVHVVWGVPKGKTTPAVLVTAYRPNPDLWKEDFKRRR